MHRLLLDLTRRYWLVEAYLAYCRDDHIDYQDCLQRAYRLERMLSV